jgi:hypothetical protein
MVGLIDDAVVAVAVVAVVIDVVVVVVVATEVVVIAVVVVLTVVGVVAHAVVLTVVDGVMVVAIDVVVVAVVVVLTMIVVVTLVVVLTMVVVVKVVVVDALVVAVVVVSSSRGARSSWCSLRWSPRSTSDVHVDAVAGPSTSSRCTRRGTRRSSRSREVPCLESTCKLSSARVNERPRPPARGLGAAAWPGRARTGVR